jgi:ATP-binding cassette subfamily C (CFTR/MRP) protein 10
MSFAPSSYSSLTVRYGDGVCLQRWVLYIFIDCALCTHFFRRALTGGLSPPVLLQLAALAPLSAFALCLSPPPILGYSLVHACIVFSLAAACVFHGVVRLRGIGRAPPPPPPRGSWAAALWLLPACLLCHSAALRLTGCGTGNGALAWVDAVTGGVLAALAALLARGGGAPPLPPPQPPPSDLEAPLLPPDALGSPMVVPSPMPPASAHDAAPLLPSRVFFSWLDPLLALGQTRQLRMGDLESLPRGDGTEDAVAALGVVLSGAGAPPLSLALLRVFGRPWAVVGLLQLGCVASALAAPLALQRLLEFLQGDGGHPMYGFLWAGAMGATQLAAALCTTQLNYRVARLQVRVRAALVGAVAARLLRAPAGVRRGLHGGALTNLVSVDVDRVLNMVPSVHQAWTLPLQVAIVLVELNAAVSWASGAGLAVLAVMVPLNLWVAAKLGALTAVMMTARDERVRGTGELLRGVRAVKLGGWEPLLLWRVGASRAAEMAALTSRKLLDAVCVWCWACTPLMMALATFALAAELPRAAAIFTPSKLWSSLAMLNLLIFPLNAFPWVLSGLLEARVSLRRLGAFLSEGGVGAGAPSPREGTDGDDDGAVAVLTGEFEFPRATPLLEGEREGAAEAASEEAGSLLPRPAAAAPAGGADARAFRLSLAALGAGGIRVRPGELLLVCGRMASGKSALLAAFAGEMVRVGAGAGGEGEGGALPLPRAALAGAATLAFAPQTPWVRSGSLVDNIVMGQEVGWEGGDDARERLLRALDAAGLAREAAARGLATPLSEGTLSGGQRARVGLARALFSPSTLVLLDDFTASLDAGVSAVVWARAVRGGAASAAASGGWAAFDAGAASFLAAEGRACVAVTTDARLIPSADRVLVLAEGRVVYLGPPGGMDAAARAAAGLEGGGGAAPAPAPPAPAPAPPSPATPEGGKKEGSGEGAGKDEAEEEERREVGHIRAGSVSRWVGAASGALSLLVLAALLLMQASRNAADVWVSVWGASSLSSSGGGASGGVAALLRLLAGLSWGPAQYLAAYAVICGVNFSVTGVRAWGFAVAGLRAASALHTQLLGAVVAAPQAFHDATPPGRLLNRLSTDQFAIDDSLPFSLNILLAQGVGLAGTVVVLAFSTSGLFLLLLPLLVVAFLRLQTKYRATSRELKRLDSVTRSPLLTQFGDMQRGEAVLRAAGANRRGGGRCAVRREVDRTVALLDASQRTMFASNMASQWLAMRLQGLGMLVLGLLSLFALLLRMYANAGAAAGADDGGCAGAGGGGGGGGGGATPDSGAAGMAGLSLSYALPIIYALQGLIGAFADCEKEFVAVERAGEYIDVAPEDAACAEEMGAALAVGCAAGAARAGAGAPVHLLPPPLPPHAPPLSLEVRDVTVRYPGAPAPALAGASVAVPAGGSLGVVGRTGSGKSTLLAALWRLVPLAGGSVWVGGEDAGALPLRELRARAAIVPQEPLLLRGTLRFNLDPTGTLPDGELLRAAAECGLAGTLAERGGGAELLTLPVEDEGRNLSLGQRQLVCLARALLRRAPLIALDEAASAADGASEAALIAALQRDAFRGATRVVVSHRLRSVLGLDAVLVLAGGRVAEAGPPAALLERGRALGAAARSDGEGALFLLARAAGLA